MSAALAGHDCVSPEREAPRRRGRAHLGGLDGLLLPAHVQQARAVLLGRDVAEAALDAALEVSDAARAHPVVAEVGEEERGFLALTLAMLDRGLPKSALRCLGR